MADITHELHSDEDATIEIGEDMTGLFMKAEGGGSSVTIFVTYEQMQRLSDDLAEWGFEA